MKPVTVKLDAKGRCCGRKPIVYQSPRPGHLYCDRCCATFARDGRQIGSFSWSVVDGGFVARVMPNGANADAIAKHKELAK